jgi:hypothetical protein
MYFKYYLKGILLLLLFSSCQSANPHHGLYNALFYDYDKRLRSIDNNLTRLRKKEYFLEKEHQLHSTVILKKEKKKEEMKKYFDQLSLDINDINTTLTEVHYFKKLQKIKELVLKIKEEINSKELFQAYLLEQRSQINDKINSTLLKIEKKKVNQTIDEESTYIQYKK